MAKKTAVDTRDEKTVLAEADARLATIADAKTEIERLTAAWNAELDGIGEKYKGQIDPFREVLKLEENALIRLMNAARRTIFSGGDIRKLVHGVLLHSTGNKVSIPRNALEKCKEHRFLDAIKTVETLIREEVQKWSDEKLFLIGAERKPAEDFEYELRKEKTHAA